MYLENINSPADVKKLSVGELTSLCAEMRVMCRGVRKEFIDRYDVGEESAANRLTPDQITADILEILN